jgi:hypothetical protein
MAVFLTTGMWPCRRKARPPKHLLLGDRVLAGEQLAQAVDEILVVGQG